MAIELKILFVMSCGTLLQCFCISVVEGVVIVIWWLIKLFITIRCCGDIVYLSTCILESLCNIHKKSRLTIGKKSYRLSAIKVQNRIE